MVWQVQAQLLRSVPPREPVVAVVLIAELPGLGHLNGHEIAALAGVAPLNQYRGQSAVFGVVASPCARSSTWSRWPLPDTIPPSASSTSTCTDGTSPGKWHSSQLCASCSSFSAVVRDQIFRQSYRVPSAGEAWHSTQLMNSYNLTYAKRIGHINWIHRFLLLGALVHGRNPYQPQ